MLSASSLAPTNSYVRTNLVSNIAGIALITDRNLVNPWDVNFPQDNHNDPPVVVADQGTGVATSYQISPDGSMVMELEPNPTVTIPTVGPSKPSGPTGVANNTNPTEFLIPGSEVPTTYIFDTLQGTIVAYNGTSAEIVVNNSSTANNRWARAEYTGLAAGSYGGQDYIYAANEGTKPGIQVFNSSFQQVTLGSFTDPYLPKGFMPYGVRDLSPGTQQSDLYVTYRGPNFQGGAVAEFTNDGTFVTQIASDTTQGGNLQSPWGLAYVQQGFGEFSGDLMVGNFSSGRIDAYNLPLGSDPRHSGQLAGTLLNTDGTPLRIPGLLSIHFGPGLGDSGSTHVGLLFTAEIDIPHIGNHNGNLEIDIPHIGIHSGNLSLYGEITPANVKLPTGMATGTGGISNIQQVSGSGQGDVLDSGSGQDIVIADSTIYDNNAVAQPTLLRHDSGSGAATQINVVQSATSDADQLLLLLAVDRVGRSPHPDFSLANDDRNDHDPDQDQVSLADEPLAAALAEWR
jgi:uncharacterized protein (TIGR03118 family)